VKIGCALLAAGAGVRFGGGKLLHEVEGEPMIARALRLFGSVPFAARVCVTRAEADEIRRMAQSGGFAVAVNPDPGRGVGTSVSIATNALRAAERRCGRHPLRRIGPAVSDEGKRNAAAGCV
jgi:CTP:molybdopterin cytidylyltransferase MocA